MVHCEARNKIVPVNASQGVRVPDVCDYSYWLLGQKMKFRMPKHRGPFEAERTLYLRVWCHGCSAIAVISESHEVLWLNPGYLAKMVAEPEGRMSESFEEKYRRKRRERLQELHSRGA